jgi:hypothetical protein
VYTHILPITDVGPRSLIAHYYYAFVSQFEVHRKQCVGQILLLAVDFLISTMTSFLQNKVKKLLEPYVELDFSIGLRNLTFRNARLKRNCLMQFGFPLEISSGVIGSIDVNIELSSKRVQITARDIVIVVDAIAADNAELRAFLLQLKSLKLEKVHLAQSHLYLPW